MRTTDNPIMDMLSRGINPVEAINADPNDRSKPLNAEEKIKRIQALMKEIKLAGTNPRLWGPEPLTTELLSRDPSLLDNGGSWQELLDLVRILCARMKYFDDEVEPTNAEHRRHKEVAGMLTNPQKTPGAGMSLAGMPHGRAKVVADMVMGQGREVGPVSAAFSLLAVANSGLSHDRARQVADELCKSAASRGAQF
jgi:hypothetical protein